MAAYSYDPHNPKWGCLACKGEPGADCQPVEHSKLTADAQDRFAIRDGDGQVLGKDGTVGLCARHRAEFLAN